MDRDAARGALLGMAVGDALGTTYEFSMQSGAPAYPALATGPATDVVGGGPFDLPPGAITDDTQLGVCLARSLAEKGRLDVDDIAKRYVAWSDHAFDIGTQTLGSIKQLEEGVSARDSGLTHWRNSGRRSAGNGSLMRTAPIGVASKDPARDAIDDSLITHADPKCALACAAFDSAIACAVAGDRTPAGMRAAAERGLADGAAYLATRLRADEPIESDRILIMGDLAVGDEATPGVHGEPVDMYRTQGFVRVALRMAFWHLAHATDWRAALVDVASRGGDSDTNAAIVGALLGARFGELAIPAEWRERVLIAHQRGPDAWGEAHHPKHLLALV